MSEKTLTEAWDARNSTAHEVGVSTYQFKVAILNALRSKLEEESLTLNVARNGLQEEWPSRFRHAFSIQYPQSGPAKKGVLVNLPAIMTVENAGLGTYRLLLRTGKEAEVNLGTFSDSQDAASALYNGIRESIEQEIRGFTISSPV